MTIRPTTDPELLARLNEPTKKLHVSLFPGHQKEADLQALAGYYRKTLTNENFRHLVAYEGETPVGFIHFEIQTHRENAFRPERRCAYVHVMGVMPDYRRKGIGRELFEAVEEEARSLGLSYVQLAYWTDNTVAKDFYKSLGFTPMTEDVWKRLDEKEETGL